MPAVLSRYVDVEEEETTLIAMSIKDLQLARQCKWGVFSFDGLRPGCYGDACVAGDGVTTTSDTPCLPSGLYWPFLLPRCSPGGGRRGV